jgi:hypothetical protein
MKWIGFVCLLGALVLAFGLRSVAGPEKAGIVQPLPFDHARHTEEGLACLDCHVRADDSPYAGTVLVKACMLCHAEAQGEHPDEPRIREFAERGEAIPWVQVNRLAGHVYFSHEAHVRWGEMDCAECHGDVAKQTEPIVESSIDHLTMERCMQCHAEAGASNDCLACHK